MSISVYWDNEQKSVCRIEFEQPFDWADYDRAIDQMWAMAKSADHPVDIIATIVKGSSLPKGLPLAHLQRAVETQPANVGIVVLVDYNPFARALIMALVRLSPKAAKSARFASSVSAAHKIVDEAYEKPRRR